jgi:hypothetical protein
MYVRTYALSFSRHREIPTASDKSAAGSWSGDITCRSRILLTMPCGVRGERNTPFWPSLYLNPTLVSTLILLPKSNIHNIFATKHYHCPEWGRPITYYLSDRSLFCTLPSFPSFLSLSLSFRPLRDRTLLRHWGRV